MKSLFAVILVLICFNQGAWSQTQPNNLEDSAKFEMVYGFNKTTQSLVHGVLIQAKNDPALIISYETQKWYASLQNGLGLWLVKEDLFKAGVSVNYLLGRNQNDDDRYRGMGNVAGTASGYLWAEWQPIKEAVTLYGNYAQSVQNQHGAYGQLGGTLGLPISQGVNAFADFSWTWGSRNYLQTYYGVNSSQTSSSGYGLYLAPSSATLYSNRQFGLVFETSPKIDLIVGLGKTSASSELMQSPLLNQKNQSLMTVVLNQRFNQ
jgi:outer membrane scaffolding protein for murein synthesis (MipA/OmpV family)